MSDECEQECVDRNCESHQGKSFDKHARTFWSDVLGTDVEKGIFEASNLRVKTPLVLNLHDFLQRM